jgi:hypothetical protein
MTMNSTGAIPSSSVTHVDREYQGVTMAEAKRRQKERNSQLRSLKQVASLVSHPGWKIVVEEFTEQIKRYESGTALKDLSQNAGTSDGRLGQEVRVCLRVADELRNVLSAVDKAVLGLKQIDPEPDNDDA